MSLFQPKRVGDSVGRPTLDPTRRPGVAQHVEGHEDEAEEAGEVHDLELIVVPGDQGVLPRNNLHLAFCVVDCAILCLMVSETVIFAMHVDGSPLSWW